MSQITIKITQPKAEVILNDSLNTATLLAGSFVYEAKNSLTAKAKSLRATSTTSDDTGIHTTCDLIFSSLSACASFIVGSETNGKKYFARFMSSTSQPTASSTAEQTATEAPAESPKPKPSPKPQKPAESMPANVLTKAQLEANNKLARDIINFCNGFAYCIDPRTINALGFESKPNERILQAMELIGADDTILNDAKSQMRNDEWKNILERIKTAPHSHGKINKRLEIFYGPAGTGKTTKALAENPSAIRIVASAGFDPDDLFTRIDPETKKWVKTDLALAMEQGQAVIIDEMNLYSPVVLQRLQGVTDETTTITDRGITIKIADGFKIIATMNLETNLGKTPLPDPLVSRASRIEKIDTPYLGWVF